MLSDPDKAFLYGACFGDGTVTKAGYLSIKHSIKQMPYLKWKVEKLCSILNCNFWIKPYDAVCKGKKYPACMWYSPVSDILKNIRKELYIDNQKTLTQEFLSNLNLQSLAILHMDDGNLHIRTRGMNKNGDLYIRERRIELSLYVSLDEALLLSDWIFDQTGAKLTAREPNKKSSPDSFNLRCEGFNARKFIQAIENFKIPSMEYKFALHYDMSSNRGKSRWSEADLQKYAEADKETRARNT